MKKIEILADAAKYDVSCSSSGSSRKNTPGGFGNGASCGICHSWSDDGRCISLLKILQTNDCVYDCVYCANRHSNDIPRATLSSEEIAELTINFYKRNYIEGLFLSSAVHINTDYTMELLIKSVRLLREVHHFNGYIHMKAIPGADSALITEAGSYVDRMSVNIELPSSAGLKLLAPQKSAESIIKPMSLITNKIHERIESKNHFKSSPYFVPAGQTTQLIVGATDDYDLKILNLSENLYKRFELKRVYYSAYVPIMKHPNLPDIINPPLQREHRLYQADWLLRFYGFAANELLSESNPNFSMDFDPKTDWAIRNLNNFPMEVNRVDYSSLLRIPGVGVTSAKRIITARKVCSLGYDDLKKIGVVLKRARFFITCKGKYYGGVQIDEAHIRNGMLIEKNSKFLPRTDFEQLSIFPSPTNKQNQSIYLPSYEDQKLLYIAETPSRIYGQL